MAAEFATKATLQSQYLNCFARGKKEKRDNPSKSAASAVFFSLCFPRPPITFTQHKKGGGKRNGYSLREMAVRAFRLKSLLLLCAAASSTFPLFSAAAEQLIPVLPRLRGLLVPLPFPLFSNGQHRRRGDKLGAVSHLGAKNYHLLGGCEEAAARSFLKILMCCSLAYLGISLWRRRGSCRCCRRGPRSLF